LLDRIIKGDYLTNSLKPHKEKWGELRLDFKETSDETFRDIDGGEKLYEGTFSVEKVTTPEGKEQENKERMKLYKHVDNLEKQDLDLLFKLMRKHIEGWWD
jgi:hypothetical protein